MQKIPLGKKGNLAYKALLNKKDPLDERILKLVKNGELKIGVVQVKDEDIEIFDDYSHKSLPKRGRHTS